MPAATVLVAEDSPLLLALLKDALLAHEVGSVVRAFADAEALFVAFERLIDAGDPIKLLVIDIVLPGEDGLALGRRVRALERDRGARPTPLVFFSSRPDDDEIAQAVADCFPARYVQKLDDTGPAQVAFEGARLLRRMISSGS